MDYDQKWQSRLTQRAADKWDCRPWGRRARFLSLVLASGLYCSPAESRLAHLRLTLTVRRLNPTDMRK